MKCQVSSPNTDLSVKCCVSICWNVTSPGATAMSNAQFGRQSCPTWRSGVLGIAIVHAPSRDWSS
jgi:hypothetical protein